MPGNVDGRDRGLRGQWAPSSCRTSSRTPEARESRQIRPEMRALAGAQIWKVPIPMG